MTQPPIYLFDGECVLCSKGVHYVLRYEDAPEMRFVTIQSAEGREIAVQNGIDADNPQSFVLIIDGQTYTHSDAVFRLAEYAGGWGRWFVWLKYLPRWLRDPAYRLIAKNRYSLFGKLDQCYVPAPDERHRFVLPD